MMKKSLLMPVALLAMLSVALLSLLPMEASASSAAVLNARVQDTLTSFRQDISGSQQVLSKAKGLLIFPRVYQGGIGLGGKYGQGALLINNRVVDHYSIKAASYGFQLGGQRKAVILAFMTDEALQKFQASQGWQVGADASVTLVKFGAAGSIDSATLNQPVLGFVLDQRGLMYNLSLAGTKISKIQKK